jgi:hypothetical protein
MSHTCVSPNCDRKHEPNSFWCWLCLSKQEDARKAAQREAAKSGQPGN